MKHPFNLLTKADVEYLRRKTACGNANYSFSKNDIKKSRAHLQTLYPSCRVQTSFAEKILLKNELW